MPPRRLCAARSRVIDQRNPMRPPQLVDVGRRRGKPLDDVDLAQHGPELHLFFRDDGMGFDVPAARARAVRGCSFGLLGMQERVELLGGQFEIESIPGRGTSIGGVLPVVWTPAPEDEEKESI